MVSRTMTYVSAVASPPSSVAYAIWTPKCGPNALISSACIKNSPGACASGKSRYGTSPAAIFVAMFRG